jgi:hypothetical protein
MGEWVTAKKPLVWDTSELIWRNPGETCGERVNDRREVGFYYGELRPSSQIATIKKATP